MRAANTFPVEACVSEIFLATSDSHDPKQRGLHNEHTNQPTNQLRSPPPRSPFPFFHRPSLLFFPSFYCCPSFFLLLPSCLLSLLVQPTTKQYNDQEQTRDTLTDDEDRFTSKRQDTIWCSWNRTRHDFPPFSLPYVMFTGIYQLLVLTFGNIDIKAGRECGWCWVERCVASVVAARLILSQWLCTCLDNYACVHPRVYQCAHVHESVHMYSWRHT